MLQANSLVQQITQAVAGMGAGLEEPTWVYALRCIIIPSSLFGANQFRSIAEKSVSVCSAWDTSRRHLGAGGRADGFHANSIFQGSHLLNPCLKCFAFYHHITATPRKQRACVGVGVVEEARIEQMRL